MADAPPILRHPGRRLLTGQLDGPSASSASKGWRGVMLEFFGKGDSDFSAIFANHGITLYLNGCVHLHQVFEGKRARNRMRAGSVIVSPAGVPKSFQYDGGGDCLVVHVAPSLIAQVAGSASRGDPAKIEILNEFCTRDPEIQRLALRLWSEYQAHDIASGMSAESLGIQMAVHLLRKYSTMRRPSHSSPGELSPTAYERAVDYIEANLANDLTIQDIADALSMSASHFAHSFKQTSGVTPHQFVMERRIEVAKALLRETTLPIANLSSRVGFSTHSHFCVTFQRLTGETPSAYRRGRSMRYRVISSSA
jgi:AraC family transcriptional regulator